MSDDRAVAGSRLMTISLAGVLLFTAAVVFLPFVLFAYRSPGLHIALDTADAMIALVVAFLVYGRYGQTGRQRELLLAIALVVLAVANLPMTAVPAALALERGGQADAWAPLLVRVVGAVLFTAAAVSPAARRVDRDLARRWVGAVALLVLWIAAIAIAAADDLPPGVAETVVLDASRPQFTGHPALIGLQALSLVLYAVAAVFFARSAARERDDFLRWLGAASVLGAGARAHYLLFPSLYSDYLYTGDVLRFGFYVLLLLGAAREVRSYWHARMEAAVQRGRRDVLREVRDVLVPRLDAVVRNATAADDGRTVESATSALREAQQLAGESAAPEAGPYPEGLDVALRDALAPLARRLGVALSLDVEQGLDTSDLGEAVVGLACAAVRGASAAGATRVGVELRIDPPVLVLQHDGAAAGLDAQLAARAERHGGVLTTLATPAGGSVVRVDWLP